MSRTAVLVSSLLLLCAAVFVQAGFAQATADSEKGFKPFGPYYGSDIESVSLVNGRLNLHIPLRSIPQRGDLNLSLSLIYDNPTYTEDEDCEVPSRPCIRFVEFNGRGVLLNPSTDVRVRRDDKIVPLPQGGSTNAGSTYTVVAGDGSEYALGHKGNGQYQAVDGSGWHYDSNQRVLIDRKGTRYSFPAQDFALPFLIEDRNGNQITPPSGPTGTWTDSLGRVFGSTATTDFTGCNGPLPVSSASVWNLPGGTIKVCFARVHVLTNFYNGAPNRAEAEAFIQPVQNVVLPDGNSWTFQYGSTDPNAVNYGMLTKVTLPTGGTISYSWGLKGQFCPTQALPRTYLAAVTQKSVDANDGTGAQPWKYSYGTATTPDIRILTDPLGNESRHTISKLGDSCSLYETKVEHFDGPVSGKLLRTEETTYLFQMNSNDFRQISGHPLTTMNVLPGTITTKWQNGATKQVVKRYDAGFSFTNYDNSVVSTVRYGSVIEEDETDFGTGGAAGPLLRRTKTTYLAFTNNNYLIRNMLDLPSSVELLDGSLAQAGLTQYQYDEAGSLFGLQFNGSPYNPVQHNQAPATGSLRGNQTSGSRLLKSENRLITSHTKYFDTGLVFQTIDPLGHTTTLGYDPRFQGTYVTQITNALSQAVVKDYDFNTGLVINSKDPNQQPTVLTYDNMLRPKTITYPDTGLEVFNYPDPRTVEHTQKIDASKTLRTVTLLDGLGRQRQTQMDDPQPTNLNAKTFTDITYDAAGRKSSESNPYRSTGDSTYGVTQYRYDGLGRLTKTIPPDGTENSNNVTVKYDDNTQTTTDQAGKQRRVYSDGLGRLVRVDEPGTGTTVQGSKSTGSVTINGNLQTTQTAGTPGTSGTGSLTVNSTGLNGGDRKKNVCEAPRFCHDEFDFGHITVSIGGTSKTINYDSPSTKTTLATDIANAFHNDLAGSADASASGTTVTFTARGVGTATNFSFSATSQTDYTPFFTGTSFPITTSGPNLTGGTNPVPPTTIIDSGTVSVTVGGFTVQTNYGQGSDATSVAGALAQGFNTDPSSPVTASLSGATVTFLSNQIGASQNVSLTVTSSTSQPSFFAQPSFTGSRSGASLTGGTDTVLGGIDTPAITLYTYDSLGNLRKVEQRGFSSDPAQWRVRTFNYDSLSRLITANNPESGTTCYGTWSGAQCINGYDDDGNLRAKTDARPITVNYSYDQLHRLAGKTYSNGDAAVTYKYDQASFNGLNITNPIGRRTSMQDASGATAWSYDSMGRLLTEKRTITTVTKTIGYQYNLDGSVKSLTYPSGRKIDFAFNAAGRQISAVDSANGVNYALNATYAPHGPLQGALFGNDHGNAGTTLTQTYNNRLQPVTIRAANPTRTVIDLTYNFNLGTANNGNLLQITNNRNTTRSQTFTYDAVNRVATAETTTSSLWANSFQYDAWGNLNKMLPYNGKPEAQHFDQTTDTKNRLVGYSYDAAGNLLNDGLGHVMTYDAENRIKTTGGATYTYDGDGQRVKKSGYRLYWWGMNGNSGPLAESWTDGVNKREYIYFAGRRIALVDLSVSGNNCLGTPQDCARYYFYPDHLGSTSVLTSTSGGTTVYEADFYPFGGERVVTSSSIDPAYRFTAKERDAESGLDYFGARYYSSVFGRFLTPDWSATPVPVPYADLGNPQSLNLYSYVENNPITGIDPDGHFCLRPGGCNGGDSMGSAGDKSDRATPKAQQTTTTVNADGSLTVRQVTTEVTTTKSSSGETVITSTTTTTQITLPTAGQIANGVTATATQRIDTSVAVVSSNGGVNWSTGSTGTSVVGLREAYGAFGGGQDVSAGFNKVFNEVNIENAKRNDDRLRELATAQRQHEHRANWEKVSRALEVIERLLHYLK